MNKKETRGGTRKNAGAKAKYLEKTKTVAFRCPLGVNIETTITDGVKKVRAFTIVAEGEIQRPHYRYLIK